MTALYYIMDRLPMFVAGVAVGAAVGMVVFGRRQEVEG